MAQEFHKLTLRDIVQETADTVTLVLDVPESLQSAFAYQHGQYLTLRFHIGGKEERRAYSMSSSPLEKSLAVTVKRVPQGKVSSHIHEQVQKGDQIEISPPEGKFTIALEEEKRRTFYLFGAGSGITPLMSILKTVLEKEPKSEVHLLYGSRDEDNIIFNEQLEALKTHYNGQLRVERILSRPKKDKAKGLAGLFSKGTTTWTGKTGRITPKQVANFISDSSDANKESVYFICGPGDMNLAVEKFLLNQGIDKERVHVEHFSGVVNDQAQKASSQDLETASVRVHLEGEDFELSIKKGKTILDAILDSNREAPYSCTAGACSTCVAKVVKGAVRMDTCLALDEEEVQDGLILTCQSHPTSAEVEITFDV